MSNLCFHKKWTKYRANGKQPFPSQNKNKDLLLNFENCVKKDEWDPLLPPSALVYV